MTVRLPRDRRSGGAKPRVLLADDHPGVLDRVSALLVDSFDVVGVATDGRQALEMAQGLDPDAVVLDINMPGFGGFDTARALERMGSRAAVVFLSLIDDDEHISEAFRFGGRGYVVKSQMLADLEAALDQALLGRRFAPSLPPLHQLAGPDRHAVHLHSNEESFAGSIAHCFDLALHRGQATCLIGLETLRDRVATLLRARGWDAGPSGAERRYRAIDTHSALADLLRDGLPDADRLREILDELDAYRQTVCVGASSRLTIAGDLSGTLCAAGNTPGALAIERLWNTYTEGRPFFTVCGYSLSCFHEHASDVWSLTAAEHTAVCHANDV